MAGQKERAAPLLRRLGSESKRIQNLELGHVFHFPVTGAQVNRVEPPLAAHCGDQNRFLEEEDGDFLGRLRNVQCCATSPHAPRG
jgi:hypothetical protein